MTITCIKLVFSRFLCLVPTQIKLDQSQACACEIITMITMISNVTYVMSFCMVFRV